MADELRRSRRQRAVGDPRWVWTAARSTAVVAVAMVVALIVALVLAIAVDLVAAQRPDHENDDGTGAATMVGLFGIAFLLPVLAALLLDAYLAVRRSRGALLVHAIGGCLGGLAALSAVQTQTWALLVVPVFGLVAALAIGGLAVTTPTARRQRSHSPQAGRTSHEGSCSPAQRP